MNTQSFIFQLFRSLVLITFILIVASQISFAKVEYQPDIAIKEKYASDYIGDNEYYPTTQTASYSISNTYRVIYYIRLQNAGWMPRYYTIAGSVGDTDWTVSYYDREIGGTEITSEVITGSWLSLTLSGPRTQTQVIRVEVTPAATAEGGIMYPVVITMSDWTLIPPDIDVVRAETTCIIKDRPDIQIKKSSETSYIGDNIYNLTGVNQSLSANINNTKTVSYYIKLENDGNITMPFTITGSSSSNGWTVSYYDATDGGTDITNDVISGGWPSNVLTPTAIQEIRVEVSPGLSVICGNIKDVYITMSSGAVKDVAKTSNTCIQGAVVEVNYAVAHSSASFELNDTPKLSMIQFSIVIPSGNEGVWMNNISLKASGSGVDNLAISGVYLIRDSNSNGFYDSGETILAGPSTYASDNSTLILTLSPSQLLPVGFNEKWLVVYQMAGSSTVGQTFNVELSIIEARGEYSFSTIILLNLPLSSNTKTISDYTVSTTTGTAPLSVTFGGQFGTGGSVVLYEWDFNYDGISFKPGHQSIFTANSVFTYTTPGNYSVRLSITYLDGDTSFRNTVITVSASSNTPVISSILLSPPPPGNAPFAITLTANANPITGQISAYLWDFDGNNTIDFISTVSQVSHTYNKADDYYATVWVQNTLGLTGKFTSTRIRVTTSTLPPTAIIDLPATDISITAGDNVLFSGQGVPSAGGVISKYEWDFDGDDNFDSIDTTLNQTYYTYVVPGTFSAKLRVTEISGAAPAGVSAETTRTIVVKPALTPRLIITQAGIYKPNKDTLREDADGYNVTIKVIPIAYNRINRVDLRYRNVNFSIPDTFSSPADDPPEIISDCWKTTRFVQSTFYPADITRENFMTTLNFRWLTTDYWYEIIALANYNPADNSYEDWNASQIQTRVFLKNVYALSPEIQEENVTKTVRTILKRQNNFTTKNDSLVFIPAEGINVVTNTLTIDTPTSVVTPGEGLTFINVFRDIKTDCAIQKLAFIKIGYPDTNKDSIVDGTTISETTLSICRYDSVNSKWLPLLNQTIDRYNKIVGGWTTDWGTFGITGRLPEEEEPTAGSSGPGLPKKWAFCFIATAAYGTPMAEEVKVLSNFRDKYLLTNPLGRRFVKTYYTVSPPLAKFIAKSPFLRYITRQVLKPVIYIVKTFPRQARD